jgi:hypothetical protein
MELILAGDNLHELSALEPEASPEPESVGGTINNQARDPMRLGAEVDDNTGAFFRDDAFGAAAFVCRKGGHGFALDARNSQVNLY